jgi:hypothetical protein
VQGNNYSTIKKTLLENIINQLEYITFLFLYNNAESGKLPRMLAAFPRSKGNPLEKEFL